MNNWHAILPPLLAPPPLQKRHVNHTEHCQIPARPWLRPSWRHPPLPPLFTSYESPTVATRGNVVPSSRSCFDPPPPPPPLIPAPAADPAFMYLHGLTTLAYATFQSKSKPLSILLCSIGSGHSFRRGGCSFAFEANVPPGLIQRQSDWRSHVYYTVPSIPWCFRSRTFTCDL